MIIQRIEKNKITFIIGMIFLVGLQLFGGENDYWIKKCDSTNIDSCAYVDKTGVVKIPFGKYPICFTDTMYNYAIVLKPDIGFVAIDRKENILFNVFPFDNGPDYPKQGMFRIIENGKIGFANLEGKVVIPPIFDAILPFENGLAAFCVGCDTVRYDESWAWENGKWGFINLRGDIVIEPKFSRIWNTETKQFEYLKEGKKLHIDKDVLKQMKYNDNKGENETNPLNQQ